MAQIIECVPNFSNGQLKETIEAIAAAIGDTAGCSLLDVDPGLSTNRTVYTFVGGRRSVVEGALNGARVAARLIDMRQHTGAHPRLGSLDVCPFIPVRGVTMEECVACAREFAERLADELTVPVYLYGEAATEKHRQTVPQIRAGEYESLSDKLTQAQWRPDFGPAEFVPQWGATIVGARKFLIAYNVNLLSTKEQAHRIALNIREQGRGEGKEGRLRHVQAMGWYVEEANLAQVSVNIMDHTVSPIHTVYREICKDAEELGLAVVGSQIVGLVPLQAMMATADHLMQKDGLFLLEDDQKIRLVVDRLGLHSLGGFNPKDRIIEYMITDEKEGPLQAMELRDFVLAVGARTPAPGGGAVAALVASLGAALGTMASFMTYGNRKFDHLDAQMRRLLSPTYRAMKTLVSSVDADASAFNQYMAACKLSHDDDCDKTAVASALLAAVEAPMDVAKTVNSLWETLVELAQVVNINCKSDLQVAAKCLETGVYGAYWNVMTNLDKFDNDEDRKQLTETIESELTTAKEGCRRTLAALDAREGQADTLQGDTL